MASTITTLKDLQLFKYQIPAHGIMPNTSAQGKPLLIYKSVFNGTTASAIEDHLSATGVVAPQWQYTMYSTSHFHSTSHEALVIAKGRAKLCFGHEDNPHKVEENVTQGHVIVVPAGVAHRLIEDFDGGFEIVGSYPKSCSWDMCYGKKGEESKVEGIHKLLGFTKDPVYGERGPVLDV